MSIGLCHFKIIRFCNIAMDKEGTMLSYATLKKIFRKLKERSGFSKPMNPHHFRHSRATDLAHRMTDAQRCRHFGWEDGSRMPKIYTEKMDMKKVILEIKLVLFYLFRTLKDVIR